MEDATLYSLTSRLELIYLIEELFLVVPFLRRHLDRLHIISGPNNVPRILARVNLDDKRKRLVIGKRQIDNIDNKKEFSPNLCTKLDNRTAKVLK